MKANHLILAYPVENGEWRISLDGKDKPTQFSSFRDIQLWHLAMMEGGLYRDYELQCAPLSQPIK